MNLSGVLPPLTTPFLDNRIAVDKLLENLAAYETFGSVGYVLLGSTGEASHLNEVEKALIINTARSVLPSERIIIAGVGSQTTAETIRLAKIAADCGADAVLVLTPHFYKSLLTREALLRHFSAVADASPVPLILYNIPSMTGVPIPVETVVELSSHNNIIGIKDSSGDFPWMLEVLARVRSDLQVISGSATLFAPALAVGATAGILAVANALPEPVQRISSLAAAGDLPAAIALNKVIVQATAIIHGSFGIPGIKWGMDARGLFGGLPRPPLLPLDEDRGRQVDRALEALVEQQIIPAKNMF